MNDTSAKEQPAPDTVHDPTTGQPLTIPAEPAVLDHTDQYHK